MDSDQDEKDVRVLQFRAQADGRRVSNVHGKIVLVNHDEREDVEDGEWWRVRLDHKETFAIAYLIEEAAEEDRPTEEEEAQEIRVRVTPPREYSSGKTVHNPHAHDLDVDLDPADRVALFVDGANMDFASRKAGFFVDWARVKDHFTSRGQFYGAFFYVVTHPEEETNRVGWLDFLSHTGYVLRPKMTKRVTDEETGETFTKANVDVEVTVDMLGTADNWDVAFLFSGNGDFKRAIEHLRSLGKRVYVVSGRTSLARDLAWAADKPVIHMENLRNSIEREDRQVEESRIAE